eukprot:Clim_evm14s202 gene=Clim_evmTU14s202
MDVDESKTGPAAEQTTVKDGSAEQVPSSGPGGRTEFRSVHDSGTESEASARESPLASSGTRAPRNQSSFQLQRKISERGLGAGQQQFRQHRNSADDVSDSAASLDSSPQGGSNNSVTRSGSGPTGTAPISRIRNRPSSMQRQLGVTTRRRSSQGCTTTALQQTVMRGGNLPQHHSYLRSREDTMDDTDSEPLRDPQQQSSTGSGTLANSSSNNSVTATATTFQQQQKQRQHSISSGDGMQSGHPLHNSASFGTASAGGAGHITPSSSAVNTPIRAPASPNPLSNAGILAAQFPGRSDSQHAETDDDAISVTSFASYVSDRSHHHFHTGGPSGTAAAKGGGGSTLQRESVSVGGGLNTPTHPGLNRPTSAQGAASSNSVRLSMPPSPGGSSVASVGERGPGSGTTSLTPRAAAATLVACNANPGVSSISPSGQTLGGQASNRKRKLSQRVAYQPAISSNLAKSETNSVGGQSITSDKELMQKYAEGSKLRETKESSAGTSGPHVGPHIPQSPSLLHSLHDADSDEDGDSNSLGGGGSKQESAILPPPQTRHRRKILGARTAAGREARLNRIMHESDDANVNLEREIASEREFTTSNRLMSHFEESFSIEDADTRSELHGSEMHYPRSPGGASVHSGVDTHRPIKRKKIAGVGEASGTSAGAGAGAGTGTGSFTPRSPSASAAAAHFGSPLISPRSPSPSPFQRGWSPSRFVGGGQPSTSGQSPLPWGGATGSSGTPQAAGVDGTLSANRRTAAAQIDRPASAHGPGTSFFGSPASPGWTQGQVFHPTARRGRSITRTDLERSNSHGSTGALPLVGSKGHSILAPLQNEGTPGVLGSGAGSSAGAGPRPAGVSPAGAKTTDEGTSAAPAADGISSSPAFGRIPAAVGHGSTVSAPTSPFFRGAVFPSVVSATRASGGSGSSGGTGAGVNLHNPFLPRNSEASMGSAEHAKPFKLDDAEDGEATLAAPAAATTRASVTSAMDEEEDEKVAGSTGGAKNTECNDETMEDAEGCDN